LDFLGRTQFKGWMGQNKGLEKLGFPWILSCETSFFNGLHGIFAGKNFSRPLPQAAAPEEVHGGLCHADAQNYS
jgi:hypothetical protein